MSATHSREGMVIRMKDEATAKKQSDTFWALKALAILSVMFAHCPPKTVMLFRIGQLFGIMGVPLFLFAAGFFFNGRESAGDFWKKKLRGVVIPWGIWGCVIYGLYCVLGAMEPGVVPFLRCLLGNGTWLYFVPMLLMCFLLYRISADPVYRGILFGLFLLFNVLSVCGVIKGTLWLTKYQIVFHWSGFFGLGVAAKANLEHIRRLRNRYIDLSVLAAWLLVGVLAVFTGIPAYWAPTGLLFELLTIPAVYVIAEGVRGSKLLRDIGKNSYPIYFIHMQFAIPIMDKVFNVTGLDACDWAMFAVKPCLVLLFTWLGIKAVQWVSGKLGFGKLIWCFGIKS